MTRDEARAHYNYLLTLCIRKAETFGPLAFAFIKDHNLNSLGLVPEEQFNLLVATAAAMKPERHGSGSPPQRIIVETDMPDYYLSIAQQRAAAYYQEKYRLSKESKIAQHFTSAARKFESGCAR